MSFTPALPDPEPLIKRPCHITGAESYWTYAEALEAMAKEKERTGGSYKIDRCADCTHFHYRRADQ